MEIVSQVVEKVEFFDLPVFQDNRDEFYGQHYQVAGYTKYNLGEHGMYIGMPVPEPCPEGLAHFMGQDYHGPGIAQKSQYYSQVYDIFELVDLQDIFQKTGKESPGSQGYHCKVEGDPESETKIVVQAGNSQTVPEYVYAGDDSEQAY